MPTDNQAHNIKSFGFVYSGIVYIWHKKELYRQPYKLGDRCYSERKLKPQMIGVTVGYYIDGTFKSLKLLKELTIEIPYSREIKNKNDCPF